MFSETLFITGQPDLVGVNDNYEVTEVHMRSKNVGNCLPADADHYSILHGAPEPGLVN